MYTHHYAQQQQQPPSQQQSISGSSLSNTSSVSTAPMMTMDQHTQMMNPTFFQHPQYPQSQYHPQMAQNIAFDPNTMTYQPINKSVMAQYPMNIQQTSLGHPPPPPTPHGQLPPQHSTVYSFVVPTQQHKRPRRRYEEIERIYQCNWEDCTKAYGTLNHLNAHVTMQKHGPKRTPEEFKEIRRLYKEKKKSEDAVRKKAAEEAQHAMGQVMPPVGHSHGSSQPGLWNNTPNSAIQMAHANTTPSSNGNGRMEHAYASNIYNMKDENYMEYFNGRNATNNANSSTSTGNVHSSNSSTSSMSHGSTVMSHSPSYNGVSSPMAPPMSMGLSSVSMSKTDSVDFNPMSFEMMSQSSLGSTVNSNNMQPSPTNSGASTVYAMNYNTMVASPSTISPASQSYPYMYEEKR